MNTLSINQQIANIRKIASTHGQMRNGCELFHVEHAEGSVTWYMTSPWTGIHSLNTDSTEINERVKAHWDGFVENNSLHALSRT